jgi:hypothetical protein
MRDPNRIDRVLRKLGRIWHRFPDQRLGQLLENYVFFDGERGDRTSVALFHQDDYLTEENLDRIIESVRDEPIIRKKTYEELEESILKLVTEITILKQEIKELREKR